MIKIIRNGQHARYQIECEYCGCLFTFEDEDISGNGCQWDYDEGVRCPFCDKDLWFNGSRSKYKIREERKV